MKPSEVKAFSISCSVGENFSLWWLSIKAFCVCLGTRKRTRPHIALIRCRFNLLVQKSDLFIMIHELINWEPRHIKNNPSFVIKQLERSPNTKTWEFDRRDG